MSSPSPSKKKISPFGPYLREDWTEAAKQELEGRISIEELIKLKDGIDILPYYDKSNLPPAAHFELPPSQNEHEEPRAWYNMPRIRVDDAEIANKEALASLNRGADGILFELNLAPDPVTLLKNIELPYCHVAFLADLGHKNFFEAFRKLVESKKSDTATLPGTIFWKTLPAGSLQLMQSFNGWHNFHPMGFFPEHQLTPSQEIATLLAKAVTQINNALSQGTEIKRALESIAFLVPAGIDFFLEIAKFKVLRMLWGQLANAYQPNFYSPVIIHATIDALDNQLFEPHGSLLKATTAGLSAILGGCDALTVETGNNGSLDRVSLNVSSILREESHLGKVADPTAGSYYLENLTDKLAQKAWKQFQVLVK